MIKDWDLRPYGQKVGDALSQMLNALAGGAPDESLSGRSYRICVLENKPALRWRFVRRCAELLFWYRDRGNHTQLAFWEDIYRARSRVAVANDMAEAVALHTFDAGDSLPSDTAEES